MTTMKRYNRALTAKRLRDLLDYDQNAGNFRWRVNCGRGRAGASAGGFDSWGYWYITIGGVQYKAHRLAWLHVRGKWPPGELDHKDMVRHHNWIDNLRPATQTENNANRRRYRNNRSGFKGVFWHKQSRKWQAMIRLDRRGIHLGLFSTAKAAHRAYVAKAKELFGQFSNNG